jgi:hypothetical protein
VQKHRPVMLGVLDGWGWREDFADNAMGGGDVGIAVGRLADIRPRIAAAGLRSGGRPRERPRDE